jgi:hypothetical protein
LTHLIHAKATPEAAVLDSNGLLMYRGRIDNWYADFGRYRQQATVHDLRDALDAILAGKKIPTPVTKPVGCPI